MTILLLLCNISSLKEAFFASFDTFFNSIHQFIIFFSINCLWDALLGRDFFVWVLPAVLIEYYHLVFCFYLAKWQHLIAGSFLHIIHYRF